MALEHLGQALTASYAIEGGTARLYERGYHSCTTSSEEPPISLRHESWSTTSKSDTISGSSEDNVKESEHAG